MTESHAIGNVTGLQHTGGLFGLNASGAVVSNASAAGTVTSSFDLVGKNGGSSIAASAACKP